MSGRPHGRSTAFKIVILILLLVMFGIVLYVSGVQVLTTSVATGILGALGALALNRWFDRADRRRGR